MLKKIILLSVFCILFQANLCYCLEWRALHERADKIELPAAFLSVNKNPESVNDLYTLGLVYLNLHKDLDAQASFEKILRLDPRCTEAKWGEAEVLRRQHKIKESEKILNEVIKEDPDFFPAYITLAYIRYIQMDFDESVRLAYKVIAAGRKRVDLGNLTRAYLIFGGTKGMIAHYGGPLSKIINGTAVLPNLNKAKALQPDSSGVMFGLGSFYLLAPSLAGKDMEQAEEYLKKAIEKDPLFADAYVRLGQLYKIKGRPDLYEELLNKALKIDPQNELALDIKEGKCKFICLKGDE